MSYNPASFGGMVVDHVRRNAYLEVLDRYVTPDSRVLDLGCGTGFFTMAALQRGAKQVTAVELLEAVRLLPKVVADNGYAGRCRIYEGDVRDLDLEPFDLVISDMRGSVPLYHDHLDVLAHVHENLLCGGATLTPGNDRLRAALVSVPSWYDDACAPWQLDGHDWGHYRSSVLTTPRRLSELKSTSIATEPIVWGAVDYQSIDSLAQRHIGGRFATAATQTCMAHGVALWFDAEIAPGIEYSTAPSDFCPTYARMLHPFSEPLAVDEGQEVTIDVMAHRSTSGWSWEWGARTSSERRAHSSLDGLLISAEQLHQTPASAADSTTSVRLL